jgi:hypothetical protein
LSPFGWSARAVGPDDGVDEVDELDVDEVDDEEEEVEEGVGPL